MVARAVAPAIVTMAVIAAFAVIALSVSVDAALVVAAGLTSPSFDQTT